MKDENVKISIVGRPNVGKSTLFNRLTKTKRAITTSIPGTTRDLIESDYDLDGQVVTLIDTGGITDSPNGMDKLVSKKALSILDKSDIILFLLDAKNVSGEDETLIHNFRKYTDKIILVINKVDDTSHDSLIWNYYSYGFKNICPISASHGRGIGELEEEIIKLLKEKNLYDNSIAESTTTSDTSIDYYENEQIDESIDDVDLDNLDEIENQVRNKKIDDKKIRISIMGKPNTGKSTLSNLLIREEKSIVSDIAGTTHDTVRGSFNYKNIEFSVCDTAGLRRKSKVNEDIEYFSVNRAIKSIYESEVILLVIDCTTGISDQDKKIASLIINRGAGVILVLNKVDLLQINNQYNAIVDRLKFLFPQLSFAPVVGISAKNQIGITKLLETIIEVKRQMSTKLSTSTINSCLEKWNDQFSPPRNGTVYYKILYSTQISVSPVRFLAIVNKKRGFPENYISYIKNKFRKQFNLGYIPIDVVIKERKRVQRTQAIFSSTSKRYESSSKKIKKV